MSQRYGWVLLTAGLVLFVGTVTGAGYMLQHAPAEGRLSLVRAERIFHATASEFTQAREKKEPLDGAGIVDDEAVDPAALAERAGEEPMYAGMDTWECPRNVKMNPFPRCSGLHY